MGMNIKLGLIVFFFIIYYPLWAAQPIVLEDRSSEKEYYFTGKAIDLLADTSRNLKIGEIVSERFNKRFLLPKAIVPTNDNLDAAYWIRFTLINKSSKDKGWLLELYDFRIDSFEIYMPDGKGGFLIEKGGDNYPFTNKKYNHKNFIFDLPLYKYKKNCPEVFYIRLYSGSPIGIIGVIRTMNRFAEYALVEYFILALFYGAVFSMALYNLFLYITIKDVAYLFYVLYLFSFSVYAMTQDGTAFQFLWPDDPQLNENTSPFALLSIMICLILYAKYFLLTKISSPFFNRTFKVLIYLRLILFVIGLFFSTVVLYRYIPYFDTCCILIVFSAGLYSYSKGYTPARYYNIAFTLFILGYLVTKLDGWILGPSFLIVYSFNIGAVGEMILLSLALGDRIKILIKEKEVAQNETIVQLKEKENLKDRINKELEQKVNERTRELQAINTQLDTFVYKASHDIKGPLKSIIGLTKVGMKDSKDAVAHEYFKHILKSTSRLDNLLNELLSMTKVQEAVVHKMPIDFNELLTEILGSFQNFEGYDKVNFKINIEGTERFSSDRQLLYSIIQNMVENSIKYRDEEKQDCYLDIGIKIINGRSIMRFSDNGLGIPQDLQDKIFDMFFKVNECSEGTGLGLHMVKVAIEKLAGKIYLDSKPKQGSTFYIEL
jgi:signal transduction histidine kinase